MLPLHRTEMLGGEVCSRRRKVLLQLRRGCENSCSLAEGRPRSKTSSTTLDSPGRSGPGESPGSVLAQATCSLSAGGYPRKTLQVLPRANTAKF